MVDAEQVVDTIGTGITVAEAAVPGAQVLIPFNPLIALVLTAIKAHYNATGKWPTEAEVIAAVPVDLQNLKTVWGNWKPSGDGT